jgi:hypothetical protein
LQKDEYSVRALPKKNGCSLVNIDDFKRFFVGWTLTFGRPSKGIARAGLSSSAALAYSLTHIRRFMQGKNSAVSGKTFFANRL